MAGGNWKNNNPSDNRSSQPRSPASTSRRAWQPGAAAPASTGGKRKSRTLTFVLLGFTVALLLAVIVVLIEWWKPASYPSMIVLAPNAPGSLALPENAAGGNVATALADWTRAGSDRPRLLGTPAELSHGPWQTRLDANAKSTVLLFTGHGGADADGPYLWFVPPDARSPEDTHKLRIREVLDRLAGLPKSQPKLLILDATRVPASWPHGMIVNDFARSLKELDADIAKIENLAVICSSDEDQRSWVSEEWRQPVFGHFVLEGLKGAAGNPGDRITAERLFDYATAEVGKWSVANRDERQSPVLLPKDSGRERASKFEIAAVPVEGYKPAPLPEPPAKMPTDLEAAWDTAWQLAGRVPAPDTLDPARWREYLDLLVRWDRLVRVGDDPESVRGRVGVLAEQLKSIHGNAEPLCLPVSFPTARALSVPTTPPDPDGFRRLWDPPTGSTRADEWAKLLGPERRGETPRRLAMASQVLARLSSESPTPESLRIADEILGVVDGSRLGPAEAHFARMLHRQLDPVKRPPGELLRTALRLRLDAEETAWVGGLGNELYPYPEQVYRWVRRTIEAGDTARELGQDLLFDTEATSWKGAELKHFPEASRHYAKAREAAKVIAVALGQRDRVLSRLPCYARWAAAYRGKMTPADVEKLLASIEAAARAAHRIADLAADVPADPAPRLAEIAAASAEADREFISVAKAFEAELRDLTNVAHPSNWHSLDNALTVPWIPARDRAKLFGYVRDVSYQLASKSEQSGGSPAPAVPAQDLAKRQGRMAVAMLGDRNAEVRQMIDLPRQGAWWVSYRDVGERIGKRYRGLTGEVAVENTKADAAADLKSAAPNLAKAAALARLAEPATPIRAGDPLGAEQRYWRHDFLLWQADRTIRAGWADVAAGPPDQWYCRKAANLCLETAKELIRGSDPNLSPNEIDRRLADARSQEKVAPVVFTLTAPKTRELADEPAWEFDFTLTPSAPTSLGFPVYWLTTPGPPYHAANPALQGRKLEQRFVRGETSVRQQIPFTAIPRTQDVNDPGKLLTTVLYRGHRYDSLTEVRLAGTPSLDWRYIPPKGNAAMACLADKGLVAGSVTLIIDMSQSMEDPIPGTNRKKIVETYDALESVLEDLPRNTSLTIGRFWGDKAASHVEPIPGVTKLLWRADAVQTRDVMKIVRAQAPVPGGNTPLARSVSKVLSRDGTAFWPANASGTRTLIMLTDGEDNWDKANAGQVVLKSLLEGNADEDTALHLVLFGMDADEERNAIAQYRVLEDIDNFRDTGRTPARLYRGVRDAKALAERLKQAMLPRVSYRREDTAGGPKQSGRVLVTLPGEGLYRPSGPLVPGVYDLWGLRAPQKLRVDAGDRVLLRARQVDGKFDLYVPPFAFETAERLDLPRETGGDKRSGIHLTIPSLKLHEKTGSCDLEMLATLEPVGGSPAGPIQEAPRPLFPWFDVAYADGKPAEARLKPGLRVVNHHGMVAGAWKLDFTNWDVNRSADTARRPAVSGYWIEGLPAPAARYAIDLRDPEQSAAKMPKVTVAGGSQVDLVSVSLEDVLPGKGAASEELPPGKYLTVRLKYAEPGKPVFLRPGKLKGTEQRFLLAERHLFFDSQTRYTARFGPLSPRDLEGAVDLELYSVPELKERAAKTARAATVRYPDRRLADYQAPDDLRLEPAKE